MTEVVSGPVPSRICDGTDPKRHPAAKHLDLPLHLHLPLSPGGAELQPRILPPRNGHRSAEQRGPRRASFARWGVMPERSPKGPSD